MSANNFEFQGLQTTAIHAGEKPDSTTRASSPNKLFCIKTGIINQKSQRSQKYAGKKSSKFRASQKATTILKTRKKWIN